MWFLSPTGRLNFGFITEGKLIVVLMTPYSWGSQLVYTPVCWDIIKVDVMATFNSLSRLDSHGSGAVNSALITLLPKSPGAEEVKDFQPISLIPGIAKWVAKVIANWLAPLLP
jgi:hypothetical protein